MPRYMFTVDDPIECCGACPLLHQGWPIYCTGPNGDRVRIERPFETRPDNCPLTEVKETTSGRKK